MSPERAKRTTAALMTVVMFVATEFFYFWTNADFVSLSGAEGGHAFCFSGCFLCIG